MKKLVIAAITGLLLAGCQTKPSQPATFVLNAKTSKAEWKGSAPDHFHIGSFDVSGTLITASDGSVKTGDFTIPIASIQDFDLPAQVKPILLADLKDNFFKITLNPNAKFHITKVEPYRGADTAAVKGANFLLTGDFNLLGQTHPISFPTRINVTENGLQAEAKFSINRLVWGMKNYDDPGKKLYILPKVNIHLKIQASTANTSASPVAMVNNK